MKLTAYLSVLVILIVLAISLFFGLTTPHPNTPQFKQAAQTPAALTYISYDFLNRRPFEGGKMWIHTASGGAKGQVFIYDIENRHVLGEVTNCWPAMLFGEPLKLLCYQPTPAAPSGLKQRLLNFVVRISRGRIKLPPAMAAQTYWLLDLKNNAARRLGDIPGTPNSLIPSPDFHCFFTFRFGPSGPEVYLLDLRNRAIQEVSVPSWGWACDWWDNTQILVRTTNCDFVLYDVGAKTTSSLLTLEKLATFFKDRNISDDPRKTQTLTIWNDRENDFYLTDTHQEWLADESFLIKLERPDGRLKLLSPRFKFGWSDHLDRTGRYYLYTGRDSGDASDGVFLRDLEYGTTRVLVSPTTNKYFSIPRFYRDSVIYVRSNSLWQVSLDGASHVGVFPPAEAPEQTRP